MKTQLAAVLMAAATLSVSGGLSPASAQQAAPVLVELYTSQGCSSCPPADALLARLAKRDDVIGLALHVEYWDYIGWKDPFADPAHTRRQEAYRDMFMARYIFTPQMVVHGQKSETGLQPSAVEDSIAELAKQPAKARLSLARSGENVTISLSPAEGAAPLAKPATVWLAVYDNARQTDVERGENAGRKLTNTNIVTSMKKVGTWDGAAANLSVPLPEKGSGVVAFVQPEPVGPVLAATKLSLTN